MKVFNLILFGYGVGLEFKKSDENYNPNKPNCKNDGSIKKFRIYSDYNKYSDLFISFRFFYNYRLLFRLFLNRE